MNRNFEIAVNGTVKTETDDEALAAASFARECENIGASEEPKVSVELRSKEIKQFIRVTREVGSLPDAGDQI